MKTLTELMDGEMDGDIEMWSEEDEKWFIVSQPFCLLAASSYSLIRCMLDAGLVPTSMKDGYLKTTLDLMLSGF